MFGSYRGSRPPKRPRPVRKAAKVPRPERSLADAEDAEEPCNSDEMKVFTRHFGPDVEQLGFRIRWSDGSGQPSVQMLEPNSAAQQRGLQEDDVILAINGIETAGKDRSVLLPSLKERPLELKLSRPEDPAQELAELAAEPVPHEMCEVQASKVEREVAEEPTPKHILTKVLQRSQTDISCGSNEEDSPKSNPITGTGSFRQSVFGDRLGLKKYVEQQDMQETLVSKTVRRILGSTKADGAFNKFRRMATNFAIWWDSLEEPPREGRIFDLVQSRWFQTLSATVIIVNAIVVTWLTDWSLINEGRNMPPNFQFVDLGFLLFYAVEVILRISVSKGFFFVNESATWNIFDLMLVVFSTMDCAFNWPADGNEAPPNNLGYMRVFRMFKFAKILRTIRIISFVRELSMMLESFRKCMVAMFWGLVLLLFLLYVFALVFAQGVASHIAAEEVWTFSEEDRELMMDSFGSVGDSMLSLYLSVTGGNDWSMYYIIMTQIGSFYPAVFLSYTFFFIFALFNILTGVFVERAVAASLPDREELINEERKKLLKQVEELRSLFKALDTDGSGRISKAEFINAMKDDRIVSYMHTLALEMHDAEHFFDIIADNCEEVDIDAFIEHSMAMRGNATALDMRRQLIQLGKVAEQLHVWDAERWPYLQRALRRIGAGRDRVEQSQGLGTRTLSTLIE
ncbi:unnamed protein product [Cladocopium goreaui]|uniref:Voltage-dependent T-type calcium channel subunit alpha-1G n=1 Tax=Cladocopium goreaui TaxID=2562237 RepID=A0A9P1D6J7_9DINO|nr:unnamed protein product [Cladocopium goreaui]